MKLYIADYLGDTSHLTTTEHGAYLLLLMAMWRAGGRLPADPLKLCRFARLTKAQWRRIEATIVAFFRVENGEMTHSRMAAEMAKYAKAVRQNSELLSDRSPPKPLKRHNTPSNPSRERARQPEPDSYRSTLTSTSDRRSAPTLSLVASDAWRAPTEEERAAAEAERIAERQRVGEQMRELANQIGKKPCP